jgi:Domain of unknown function (DUF4832)/Domain of unknown function (DUF4874)
MMRNSLLQYVLGVVALSACTSTAKITPNSSVATTNVRFETSLENFANPERGLPMRVDPPWAKDANGNDLAWKDVPWDFCGSGNNFTAYNHNLLTQLPTLETLKAGRANGQTLILVRYHIAAFRNSDLSQAFLDSLNRDFTNVREAGIKIVPRFAYNYPKGGPDAPLERVLRHLDQLKPVLENNTDVIAFMDTGLIGCWGEMHTSSNDLMDISRGYRRLNDATKQILEKLFATLPKRRMITVRYPEYKFQYFNGLQDDAQLENKPIAPISSTEAFNETMKSRWAQYDDCIACGEWNAGTYYNPHSTSNGKAGEVKDFLEQDLLYAPHSGEVGATHYVPATTDEDGDGWGKDHDSCARVLPLFAKVRFSTFNHNDDPVRMERWRNEGCYDEISRRLGYRFSLIEANMPTSIRPGSSFEMNFFVKNEGWASPYNSRLVEINLQNTATGQVYTLRLEGQRANNEDPRFWQPGGTYQVNVVGGLPSAMPVGDYRVALVLPDPEPALYNRAEYAIRLANKNVWDGTGINDLLHTVRIDSSAPGTAYQGSLWFR